MKIGLSSGNITQAEIDALSLGDDVDVSASIIEEASSYFARDLISAGNTIVYGHDWRPSGMMQAVAEFAKQDRLLNERAKPSILNFVPNQPDTPVALPADLSPNLIRIVPLDNNCMYNLRTRLVAECDTCICMGGKLKGFQGDIPGIFEEAWRMARATLGSNKHFPIICGCLAGAAGWLAQSLNGQTPFAQVEYDRNSSDVNSSDLPESPAALADSLRNFFATFDDETKQLHQRLWIEKTLTGSRAIVQEILERYSQR